MFPKEIRLHLRLERDFFRRSKRGSFSVGNIYYVPFDKNLFAITISKNYSLSAVKRNVLKRFLKEKVVEFHLKASKDINYKVIILVNRQTIKTKQKVWEELYEVFSKLYKK